jgi:DNA-directed RNA polymerase beta' subunit
MDTQEIVGFKYYVRGDNDIKLDAVVEVTNADTHKGDRPVSKGVLDHHMGTINNEFACGHCFHSKTLCPGHQGVLALKYPVINPCFSSELIMWLRIICHNCGHPVVELPPNNRKRYLLKEVAKNIKPNSVCIHCMHVNKSVSSDRKTRYDIVRVVEEKRTELFYNHEIYKVISKIQDSTVAALGVDPKSHPRNLIWHYYPVAPNTLRPNLRKGGTRIMLGDLTTLIRELANANLQLPNEIPDISGDPQNRKTYTSVIEKYRSLNGYVYNLNKGRSAGKKNSRNAEGSYALLRSCNGKRGDLRGHVFGKPSSNVMRSVITSESQVPVSGLGIPQNMAVKIPIPDIVTPWNRVHCQMMLNNGTTYPSVRNVKSKNWGNVWRVTAKIPENYILEVGDEIKRDMITGDQIGFGRQPSLEISALSGHRVTVFAVGDTFCMNVSACKMYAADFDGDTMYCPVPVGLAPRVEVAVMANVGNWFNSHKNHAPRVGAFQDSLIGTARFSHAGTNLSKFHAMQLFAYVEDPPAFTKTATASGAAPWEHDAHARPGHYTSRELISALLPNITLSGTPSYYNPDWETLTKYSMDDVSVRIESGIHKSGVLDKNTIGQGKDGSIFHIIHNEYGPTKALDTVMKFHQLIYKALAYDPFTVTVGDMFLSQKVRQEVNQQRKNILYRAEKITQKLMANKLHAPIGISMSEYLESLYVESLQHADKFTTPILSEIDINTNGTAALVGYGSKGDWTNMLVMSASIGQVYVGEHRPDANFGLHRASPYFHKYSMHPVSRGYITASFAQGIPSYQFAFACAEGRHQLMSNCLSTALSGEENRNGVKNFESVETTLLRSVREHKIEIQPLYAENGVDPRKLRSVNLKIYLKSLEDFKAKCHTALDEVAKKYQNKEVERLLKAEYETLKADRQSFRAINMLFERERPSKEIFKGDMYLPLDMVLIVESIKADYKAGTDRAAGMSDELNPIEAIQQVTTLCDNLVYVYWNDIQERRKTRMPDHFHAALTFTRIFIRYHLSIKSLLLNKINNMMLKRICEKVKHSIATSLIDPYISVGIIAAQCINEPITQSFLDSKHRAGKGGGTKVNLIKRVKEIFGAIPTKKMSLPTMMLNVLAEYQDSENKVREIANKIEMLEFKQFVSNVCIFYEPYGKPVHPKYKHEDKIYTDNARTLNVTPPRDLTQWVIRFELNRDQLILKSILIEDIIFQLRILHPYMHWVWTPETAKVIVIRGHVRAHIVASGKMDAEKAVIAYMQKINSSIVRGIIGIIRAVPKKIVRSILNPDDSITLQDTWMIATEGTNLAAILKHPDFDPYSCQSDSLQEMTEIFGIACGSRKITAEILSVLNGSSEAHATIYATEMTYMGYLTPLNRAGLLRRVPTNVSQRASFMYPIAVYTDAAAKGIQEERNGISTSVIAGQPPRIGTAAVDVIINESMLSKGITAAELDLI